MMLIVVLVVEKISGVASWSVTSSTPPGVVRANVAFEPPGPIATKAKRARVSVPVTPLVFG